jgi:hypothetical protein
LNRNEPSPDAVDWSRRLGWLALFWLSGVAGVGVVAWVLKLLLRAVGLTT